MCRVLHGVSREKTRGKERIKMQIGEFYKQKDGKLCQIIALAKNYETEEREVVYQKLYGTYESIVCPIRYFDTNSELCCFTACSKEDIITEQEKKNNSKDNNPNQEEVENTKAEQMFFAFLDAESSSEKIEILEKLKPFLDVRMVNNIAAAMDLPSDEEDVEAQYTFIMQNLLQRSKFECNRFR